MLCSPPFLAFLPFFLYSSISCTTEPKIAPGNTPPTGGGFELITTYITNLSRYLSLLSEAIYRVLTQSPIQGMSGSNGRHLSHQKKAENNGQAIVLLPYSLSLTQASYRNFKERVTSQHFFKRPLQR